jgi:glutaredoxin-related protein
MYRTSPWPSRSDEDDSISLNDVVRAIRNHPIVILYSPWCGYSRNAIQLLETNHLDHVKIDLEKIDASLNEIRTKLAQDKKIKFDVNYSTRPMIFINGVFRKGYDQLKNMITNGEL